MELHISSLPGPSNSRATIFSSLNIQLTNFTFWNGYFILSFKKCTLLGGGGEGVWYEGGLIQLESWIG